MTIKKLSGSLVAATLIFGLNSVAMADCADVILDIQTKADEIRDCYIGDDDNAANDPIWQHKGKPSCFVNDKVTNKLYVERDDTPPPKNKGKAEAAGAAQDFASGKYDAGQAKLQDFIDTLLYSAKALDGQQGRENALVEWAVGMQTEAMACQ